MGRRRGAVRQMRLLIITTAVSTGRGFLVLAVLFASSIASTEGNAFVHFFPFWSEKNACGKFNGASDQYDPKEGRHRFKVYRPADLRRHSLY
jgi:hypothetical protein